MAELLIRNAVLLDPLKGRTGAWVLIDGRSIAAVGAPDDPPPSDGAEQVDAQGRLLTPGLIDLHIHGIERWLFEAGPDDLVQGVDALAQYGVTTVLPTLYRVLALGHLDRVRELAAALKRCRCVQAPGLHLEGPFLWLAGAGGETLPGDVSHLEALFAAADGAVEAMSISPDTPDIIPVIRRLVERGAAPFITHTQADVEQTEAAIEAGARHATHFYDVFPAPACVEQGARPVGCVEAILADPRVSVDFIADGVHVHPTAIKAALAAKDPQRLIAITDANIGAGLAEGTYDTGWGYAVEVRPGDAARIRLPGDPRDGVLAGSALTMPQAIANLRRWLKAPEQQVWAMASWNPAALMGWPTKGRIEPGADADLVLWDDPGDGVPQAARTWSLGRCVYDRGVMMESAK